MKYKFSRKINLSNIDSKLFAYETEDIGAEDADSFEEVVKIVDKFVDERINYYKNLSNMQKEREVSPPPISATPPPMPPVAPPIAPLPVTPPPMPPVAPPPLTPPPTSTFPEQPAPLPSNYPPVAPPPQKFQV